MARIINNGVGEGEVTQQDLAGLKQYFLTTAALSTKSHKISFALEGVNLLNTIPLVTIDGSSAIKVSAKSKTVKFDLVDHLSHPFEGLKSKDIAVTL